jgi:hypothetical protein
MGADNADGKGSPKNAVIPIPHARDCGVEGSPIASGHRKLPIRFHLVCKLRLEMRQKQAIEPQVAGLARIAEVSICVHPVICGFPLHMTFSKRYSVRPDSPAVRQNRRVGNGPFPPNRSLAPIASAPPCKAPAPRLRAGSSLLTQTSAAPFVGLSRTLPAKSPLP